MTQDERIAELERRVNELEQLTMMMRPLGPRPEDAADRQKKIEHVVDSLREAMKAAEAIPVDRDCRTLTDGSPVTPDHREIDPATGQQKGYVVLCESERKKGFVRPVRRSYVHQTCGQTTYMGIALAETYARDPLFYSGTFCATCRAHFPLDQFTWSGTKEVLGT